MIEAAISTCPNDLFAFYHWAVTNTPSLKLQLEDIDTLNQLALERTFDLIKVSMGVYSLIEDTYEILDHGAAICDQGPLLIYQHPFDISSASVAIPGVHTTAASLLQRYFPDFNKRITLRFDQILDAVKQQEVDAGVLIHESRFCFEKQGLKLMADLGKLWQEEFQLPIPLGVIVMKKSLEQTVKDQIQSSLKNSIAQGDFNDPQCRAFILNHSQEKELFAIENHLKLYVNHQTYQCNEFGKRAIQTFIENYTIKQT